MQEGGLVNWAWTLNICVLCVWIYCVWGVCTYAYFCGHTYVHGFAFHMVWTHKRPDLDACCLLGLFTLCFEAGSLTDPGVHQFSETGWPWNSKVLPLWESPALESECMPPHPALHMNSGDLNLGPDAYAASTLPADPSEAARPYHCWFLLGTRWQKRCREGSPTPAVFTF